jgi:hydrogenase expression/formation protein HypD
MSVNGLARSGSVETLLEDIRTRFRKLGRKTVRLMEVCGTHTMSIARAGLKSLLPEGLKLISGPGCPVCVTPTGYIDAACDLARRADVVITTFGDMMRVPGTNGTLEVAKAEGADVRMVYSPMKSLEIAAGTPGRTVVFLGVGFETTAPATATLIKAASEAGTTNLTVLPAHKLIPPALRVIASDPELGVDGFILPGHVSVVIGTKPYRFLADEFKRPCVITGFEPQDILEAISMLLDQISSGKAEVQNQYRRIVRPEGNPQACRRIAEIFQTADASWRAFGVIPRSGLALGDEHAQWDAGRRFDVTITAEEPETGCLCGDVLKGKIHPRECPLFGSRCTPASPVGPCMVSSEGACAASFRFEQR